MPTPTDIDETESPAQPGEASAGPYTPGQSPQDLATLAAARDALTRLQSARGDVPTTPTAPQAAPQIAPQPQSTLDNLNSTLPPESWASKAYHGILTGLGGKYDTQFIPTPNGVVQQQVAQTPGQQWKRIISGAITGVGAAAQAGTQGPGGAMRGLGAGINAGYGQRVAEGENQEKRANTQFSQEQQAAMNSANRSLIASRIAESTWNLSFQKKEAYKSDLSAEANLMKTYEDAKDQGAVDLGVMPTFQDAIDKFNNDPTLHDKHGQGQIMPVGHVNAAGEIDGVHAIWVPKAWQDQKVGYDATFHMPIEWDDKGNPTKFQDTTIGKSTGLTGKEFQDQSQALIAKVQEYHKNQVENQTRQEQADIAAKKAPSEIAQAYAAAGESEAKADYYKGKGVQWGNPVAEGTFDPDYPPPQNFPSGTPGIDQKQIGKIPAKIADNRVLAETILENTAAALRIIQRRPDIFGKLQGRESTAKEWLGTNDKDLAELYTRLDNIARPSVGIHGTRAQSAVDEARVSLMNKFKNGPEATTQALMANVDSARNFIRAAKNYEVYGTEQGPIRSLALHAPAVPGAGGAPGAATPGAGMIHIPDIASLPVSETAPAGSTSKIVKDGRTYWMKGNDAIGVTAQQATGGGLGKLQ